MIITAPIRITNRISTPGPRLGDPGAVESLRKTAALELLGGLIVILVTAIRVALPTPAGLAP